MSKKSIKNNVSKSHQALFCSVLASNTYSSKEDLLSYYKFDDSVAKSLNIAGYEDHLENVYTKFD